MRKEILNKIKKPYIANKINLSNSNINDGEILEILQKIHEIHPDITCLNLDSNDLGNDGASTIANYLENFHMLEKLGLQFNNIESEGAKALFAFQKSKEEKLTLVLHGNNMGSVDEVRNMQKKC